MSVQFDTDSQGIPKFTSRTVLGQAQTPGMVSWLIRKGIIKDESQAGGLLVGVVLFNIIVTGVVVYLYVL